MFFLPRVILLGACNPKPLEHEKLPATLTSLPSWTLTPSGSDRKRSGLFEVTLAPTRQPAETWHHHSVNFSANSACLVRASSSSAPPLFSCPFPLLLPACWSVTPSCEISSPPLPGPPPQFPASACHLRKTEGTLHRWQEVQWVESGHSLAVWWLWQEAPLDFSFLMCSMGTVISSRALDPVIHWGSFHSAQRGMIHRIHFMFYIIITKDTLLPLQNTGIQNPFTLMWDSHSAVENTQPGKSARLYALANTTWEKRRKVVKNMEHSSLPEAQYFRRLCSQSKLLPRKNRRLLSCMTWANYYIFYLTYRSLSPVKCNQVKYKRKQMQVSHCLVCHSRNTNIHTHKYEWSIFFFRGNEVFNSSLRQSLWRPE